MTQAVSDQTVILADPDRLQRARRSGRSRKLLNTGFQGLCIVVASLSLLVLAVLLGAIAWQGIGHLDWQFLTSSPSANPALAGIGPALWGTVWLCTLCALFALPLGVATAVFLEEYKPRSRALRKAHGFFQLNITNLAGVPSVVYGIIGLTAFVSMFGLFSTEREWGVDFQYQFYQFTDAGEYVILVDAQDTSAEYIEAKPGLVGHLMGEDEEFELNVIEREEPFPTDPELAARTVYAGDFASRVPMQRWYYFRLPLGRGVLTGALTLMLVVLPIVIIASQEALRAVPGSLRQGALAMGATKWQVVRRVTLPAALPGILTASIIAMSRAIGEAAPLLMIAGIVFITSAPGNVMDDFTALPLQIFNWAGRPQTAYHEIAAAGILVLLAVLLTFNAVAVILRQKLQKPLS